MSSNQRLWAIPGFGFAQPANGSAVEPAADWIPVMSALAETTSWDSSLQSGRYTFLLQVIDSSGNTYYGVQRGWLDNEDLRGRWAAVHQAIKPGPKGRQSPAQG